MKNIPVIILLAISCSISLPAQEQKVKKPKVYKTWITDLNGYYQSKGILYEVKDSSLLIVKSFSKPFNPAANFDYTDIPFNKIDIVKTLRSNSIEKGLIIGGGIMGLTMAIGLSSEDLGRGAGLIIVPVAIISGLFGSAVGGLIGSIKARVPIHGSFENFNLNRNRLQSYSYVNEYSGSGNVSGPVFDHRSYIGYIAGPSFPVGKFAGVSPDNETVKNGYYAGLKIDYRITAGTGISVSLFDNQYDVKSDRPDLLIGITGITAGPLFSFPLAKRVTLDLKPEIGFGDAYLIEGAKTTDEDTGFVTELNTSVSYDFARRWCLITGTGYFFSGSKLGGIKNKNIRTFNLDFGIGYRFR